MPSDFKDEPSEIRPTVSLWVYCLSLVFFVSLWVATHRTIYFDSRVFLPEDSFKTHFNLFAYLYNFIRFFHTLPAWVYSARGGMWVAPLANNYLVWMPYRLVGYAFALLGIFPAEGVYKFCFLLLGVGSFLGGVYLLGSEAFRSRPWSFLLVIFVFLSGVHIGLLHQEQVLGTVYYLPFIWWAVLKMRQDGRWGFLAFSLVGLSLNNHYPQILTLYYVFVAVLLGRGYRSAQHLKALPVRRRVLFGLVCMGCFLFSSLPLWHAYGKYKSALVSPFRAQTESIEAQNYSQYLALNQQQLSSVWPENFRLLVNPDSDWERLAPLDRFTFYLGPLFLLFFLVALSVPIPFKLTQLVLIGLLMTAAVGIYGPLPRLLYPWFPGIRLFRQWFHFLPLMNLHLLFFLVWGMKTLWESKEKPSPRAGIIGIGLCVLFSLFHWLPWVIGTATLLGGAVLYCLTAKARRSALVVLVAIHLVGSAVWANATWGSYERYFPKSRDSSLPLDEASVFLNRILFASGTLYEPLSVAIGKINRGSGTLSWDLGGKRVPAQTSQFLIEPQGEGISLVLLSRPEQAEALLIPQFNDGEWIAEIGSEKHILSPQATPDGDLKIPVSADTVSLTIRRAKTIWAFAGLWMWLPLILSAFWLKGRRK